MSAGHALLILSIAAPALASLIALLPAARPTAQHVGVAGAALAALASVALLIGVATTDHTATISFDAPGDLWLGVTANHLTALLLVLVTGVNAVVQVFARRQLLGDAAGPRFAIRAGFLISSTAVMVSAASVITLAVGWTLAGLALIALVALYWPEPAARDAARHTTRMVVCGDAALWAGTVLFLTHGGSQDMASLAPAPDAGPVVSGIIAVLLVIAAAARCSQMPFHRWLSASLSAPTPVSAILHAGVVNAGGILLVRLYPVVADSWWATGAALGIAAFGTVVATLIMLARPDIKGALVYSTIAQMAFLLLACSMGLLAAAISHLIAHGMFKSTLFLGSTSTVGATIHHDNNPIRTPLNHTKSISLGLLAVAVAVISIAGWVPVLHPESGANGAVLMAFATVTAAAAGWGWIHRYPSLRGGAVLVVAVPLLAGIYLSILTLLTGFLNPVLAPAGPAAAPAWTFAAVLLVLLAAWYVPTHGRRFATLKAWLYAHLLSMGQPIAFAPRSRTAPAMMPSAGPRQEPAFAGVAYAQSASVLEEQGVRL